MPHHLFRYVILISCLSGIFFCSTPTAAANGNKVRYSWAFGRKYVYLNDVAKYYNMRCYTWKDRTVLYSKYSKLIFYPDKKDAYINGVKVLLSFATFTRADQSYLSAVDFLNTIDPILRCAALKRHRMKLILLDVGHGGKDNGGQGRRSKEKNVVLSLANKVSYLLKRKGYSVIMTRTNDSFISLQQRVEAAHRLGADIFISLHTNIAGNRDVSGIETFCLAPAGTSSTHAGKIVKKSEPGNVSNKNNMALAYHIQKSLIKRAKSVDRGVKRARFYVLKNVTCPAILVEVGFLSNRNEESRLNSDWYQNLLCYGIVEGVLKYHRRLIPR